MKLRPLTKLPIAVVLASVMTFMAPAAKAATTLIDFDSVDTSGGTVVGAPVLSYLAGFGISFSASSSAINPVIEPYPYWMSPVSGANDFGPQGLATAFSYTLSFSSALDSLSFTRPGFNPAIMSAWSATAYSATNTVLAAVSEGLTFNASPMTFTLTGSGIDHVVFTDNAFSFAGTNFRMDNLTLTTPVPEPETYAMLLAGLGLLGWQARRRKLKPAA